jgi:hypothetical protein
MLEVNRLSPHPAKLLSLSATDTHLLTGKTTPALADRLTLFFLTFPARPDILTCDDYLNKQNKAFPPSLLLSDGLQTSICVISFRVQFVRHGARALWSGSWSGIVYAHAQNRRPLPICMSFLRGRSLASYGCYAWVSPGSITLFRELTKPPRAHQKFSKPQIGMNRISSSWILLQCNAWGSVRVLPHMQLHSRSSRNRTSLGFQPVRSRPISAVLCDLRV